MTYRFGEFELDPLAVELRAGGIVRPLEPQVFALLALLVEHRERMVSKDELIEKVWDGRVVSDAALASRVKSARQALGDDGTSQRCIRTIHGRGFRFVAPVQTSGSRDAAGASAEHRSPADAAPQIERSGRPSIAVLPFRTLGREDRFAVLGAALADELITELARLRWLFVTARGSSFRLGGGSDIAEIGRLLGVRYCLRGTLELGGRNAAIVVDLIDTHDCGVVWGDRFAGRIDDLHGLRGQVRQSVLTALEIRIPQHEAELARTKATEDLDAWSMFHLGLQHMYRFNRADSTAASACFERAVSLDPGFARAHAGLSFVHFQAAFLHQAEDVAGEILRARRCAERGIELDSLDPFVNFTMGRSYWIDGDLESARSWLVRATGLSPNYAQGIYARAVTEALSEHALSGREHVDLAMRLSPLDPLHYAMQATRGFTHMALGEDELAAEWTSRAACAPGAHVLIAMIAAVAQALKGDAKQAARWVDNVRRRNAALTREDYCRAFPMQAEPMRTRVVRALTSLGF